MRVLYTVIHFCLLRSLAHQERARLLFEGRRALVQILIVLPEYINRLIIYNTENPTSFMFLSSKTCINIFRDYSFTLSVVPIYVKNYFFVNLDLKIHDLKVCM